MSALIKQASADVKRAMPLSKRAIEITALETKPDLRDAEIEMLRGQTDQLEAELAQAKKAKDEARDAGRKAGLAEAERQEAARISLLKETLTDAVTAFETRLEILDGLAPQLARAALEKLCVPPDNWTTLIEAMIKRQLAVVRRSTVVALRVSPADFDEAAAAALDARFDPDLGSGAARIELKLGLIDLDVRDQWSALVALLDEMAGEGA